MHDDIKKTSQEKMKKTLNVFRKDLAGLRAGRANPQILDRIMVDYYGVPTPLNQLGSISAPEPRLLVISPWDTNALKEIEKAIQKSDLGINPNNDGKVIRLVMPELTEERRKELTKVVRKKGEEAKIAVRSIRRDANDQYRKLKKDSQITEDELRIAEEEIQELTDDHIKEIDKIVEAKEAEIMEV